MKGTGTKEASQSALRRLVTIAWLSILLGLVIQALILVGKLAGGAPAPGPPVLAGVAQGVTWSLLVCLGVGIGAMVMRAPISLAGLIGFASAPIALGTAKGVQRAVGQLLDTPQGGGISLALLVIALIKAFEYGFLTFMLCRWFRKKHERLLSYLLLGIGTGVVFGGVIVLVSSLFAHGAGNPLAPPALIGLIINETLFPVGCAMVIYAWLYIGRHVKVIERAVE